MNYIGIDIGSTCAKTVVLNEKKEIIREFVQPTGWSSIDTAEEILQKLKFAGINLSDDSSCCVATGYGRISVPYADKAVTEITCHALGAVHLFHQPDLTVIDIGGQDTKIIQIEQGFVKDFIMNDKCAAGTGRFLEVMANTLSLRPNEMFELARLDSDTTISSMCTVFAESEVIGLIGKGEPKENIAYAVVDSTIRKVTAQLSRMNGEMSTFCLTGGLCECEYIRELIKKTWKRSDLQPGCPLRRCDRCRTQCDEDTLTKNAPEQTLKPILSRGNLYSFTYILLSWAFLFVYYLILKIGLIFL